LIHPSGHGDQQESERVEGAVRIQTPLSRALRVTAEAVLSIRSEFWTLRDRRRLAGSTASTRSRPVRLSP
jgi:hypothetical protein